MNLKTVIRDYRNSKKSFNITYKESDINVFTDTNLKKQAYYALLKYRNIIENHIKINPEFLTSLKPIKNYNKNYEDIIYSMYKAGEIAEVGPFASVAGAIAEYVACELHNYSNEVIVENGGDVYIIGNSDKTIQILHEKISNLGIKIKSNNLPISICSSSSTIGHSLSFGKAELVIVLSKKGTFADAFATSICNQVKQEKDIQKVIKKFKTKKEIAGVIIFFNNKIAGWGNFEIVKLV